MNGNYLAGALRIAASAPPGSLLNVSVLHDEWCALLAGTGACDCDPEFIVARDDPDPLREST